MSFEGHYEYICVKGHYWTRDVHSILEDKDCPYCLADPHWEHLVDETNGICEDDLDFQSQEAPKLEAGLEDHWKHDRHGNKYAETVSLFSPNHPSWIRSGALPNEVDL